MAKQTIYSLEKVARPIDYSLEKMAKAGGYSLEKMAKLISQKMNLLKVLDSRLPRISVENTGQF